MDIVERWREQECEDLLAPEEDFSKGAFEMDWTTLLAYFLDKEDMKDFVREEPFSRLHTVIESVNEVDLYVRVKTDEKHLRPLMAVLLAYGAVPHVLKTE